MRIPTLLAAFDFCEEARHRKTKAFGDPLNVIERDVDFAPLDRTHVSPMEAAPVGEAFLRHPCVGS